MVKDNQLSKKIQEALNKACDAKFVYLTVEFNPDGSEKESPWYNMKGEDDFQVLSRGDIKNFGVPSCEFPHVGSHDAPAPLFHILSGSLHNDDPGFMCVEMVKKTKPVDDVTLLKGYTLIEEPKDRVKFAKDKIFDKAKFRAAVGASQANPVVLEDSNDSKSDGKKKSADKNTKKNDAATPKTGLGLSTGKQFEQSPGSVESDEESPLKPRALLAEFGSPSSRSPAAKRRKQ
eukprot:gene803-179_t